MQVTTYTEARQYLEDLIKPYQAQRIEGIPEEFNNPLGRMKYLLNLLDNPEKKFPSIVVSGTSGKSSTTYYIAHALTTVGYKVGMTISPHLQKLNERLQINNIEIPDDVLVEILNDIIPAVEKMKQSPLGAPSYFETLLALAFYYFAKEKVDIVVAEVGLEGKFDGTNVLERLVFVYTNTSLDHTQILGETVEEIAKEGVAGIQKHSTDENAPIVITGVSQPSVIEIFTDAAEKARVPLRLLGKDFSYELKSTKENGEVFDYHAEGSALSQILLPMKGEYQAQNAVLAIDALFQLKKFGFEISPEQIHTAFSTAFFPGRFETVEDNLIIDGAHNPAKMQAFISSLEKIYPDKKKIFVLGFKEGKNISAMLQIVLPIADAVVTTEFHSVMDWTKNPSVEGKGLYDFVKENSYLKIGTEVYQTLTVKDALEKAKNIQQQFPEDIIVITGSLYLVGEVRAVLMR